MVRPERGSAVDGTASPADRAAQPASPRQNTKGTVRVTPRPWTTAMGGMTAPARTPPTGTPACFTLIASARQSGERTFASTLVGGFTTPYPRPATSTPAPNTRPFGAPAASASPTASSSRQPASTGAGPQTSVSRPPATALAAEPR